MISNPLLGFLVILGIQIHIVSATLTSCSSTNLGTSDSAITNLYMSNGLCSDNCGDYSYAIVLGTKCWCSNSAPSNTVSTSDCSSNCPGYPLEKCGNEGEGYYGYIYLGQDSETTAATSTSNTKTSATSTTSALTTKTSTVTSSSSPTTADEDETATEELTTEPATTSTTASDQATTTSDSPTSSIEPITSIVYSVMTITGNAETQYTTTEIVSTVISLPSATGSSGTGSGRVGLSSLHNNSKNSESNNDGFFEDTGKVAGVFSAVGAIVLAILAALLYYILRMRSENNNESDIESTMSPLPDEKFFASDSPGAMTSTLPGGVAGSSGSASGTIPPLIPIIGPDDMAGLDQKSSDEYDFVQIDQRLDPNQMFMKWENGSRQSLADDMDYSRRVLRVTNAD